MIARPGHSLIPLLSRMGDIVAHAKVSPEDFAALSAHRWGRHKLGYAVRYERIDGTEWTAILMHRCVLGLPSKGRDLVADHINGDRLDNRRENLRAVPHALNLTNRRGANRNNQTGARNVALDPKSGRYRVRIGMKYAGTFRTLEEAAQAAARARAEAGFLTGAEHVS